MTPVIDLTLNEATLQSAAAVAKDRDISIPTFAMMRDPSLIPDQVKTALKGIGLWDLHPLNLYRISWHNEPTADGGGFGDVNYVEWPSSLTGVSARIVSLVGKWFPTGAHKVGAAFACLVPPLVTGQFDPTTQKAIRQSVRSSLPLIFVMCEIFNANIILGLHCWHSIDEPFLYE